MLVERTQGCDHMTCRCGQEFCYRCGGLYGECLCMATRPYPIFARVPGIFERAQQLQSIPLIDAECPSRPSIFLSEATSPFVLKRSSPDSKHTTQSRSHKKYSSGKSLKSSTKKAKQAVAVTPLFRENLVKPFEAFSLFQCNDY